MAPKEEGELVQICTKAAKRRGRPPGPSVLGCLYYPEEALTVSEKVAEAERNGFSNGSSRRNMFYMQYVLRNGTADEIETLTQGKIKAYKLAATIRHRVMIEARRQILSPKDFKLIERSRKIGDKIVKRVKDRINSYNGLFKYETREDLIEHEATEEELKIYERGMGALSKAIIKLEDEKKN